MLEYRNLLSERESRAPTPFASGMVYLSVLILMLLSPLITNGMKLEGDIYYLVLFLIQVVCIGLPPLIYVLYFKKDIKYSYRLGKTSLPEIMLTIGMAVFGYGIIIFINLLWILFLSRFGTPRTVTLPPIETGRQYLLAIAVISLTPAVLEEFMCRGVIQRGYERCGIAASVLLTVVFFAFLHISIVSIPAIIFMGILLSYIGYRAKSIWVSITYHFVNNSIAVTFAYLSNFLSRFIPADAEAMYDSLADIPLEEIRLMIISSAFLSFFALLAFIACFTGFIAVTRNKHEGQEYVLEAGSGARMGFKWKTFIPVVLAIVLIITLLVFEIIEMVNPEIFF